MLRHFRHDAPQSTHQALFRCPRPLREFRAPLPLVICDTIGEPTHATFLVRAERGGHVGVIVTPSGGVGVSPRSVPADAVIVAGCTSITGCAATLCTISSDEASC